MTGPLQGTARERFACRRCGACCRIPDGIVRVSEEETARIARFLGESEEAFLASHAVLAPDRRGLVLSSRPDGACEFLRSDNRCRIHPVKPDKCRTFPFDWANADSEAVCPALAEALRATPSVPSRTGDGNAGKHGRQNTGSH